MDGLIAYTLSKKYADEVGRSILDAGFKTQVEQDRSVLQTTGQEKILYFIPKTTAKPSDGYDEYVYSNNAWEQVGATDVDLNYELLSNKPQINGIELVGNILRVDFLATLGINQIRVESYDTPPSNAVHGVYLMNCIWISEPQHTMWILENITADGTHDYFEWERLTNKTFVSTDVPPDRTDNNVNYLYEAGDFWVKTNLGSTELDDLFICVGKTKVYIDYRRWYYSYVWKKAGSSEIASGVVNQNGTISFYDADGNLLFTTTGASVIGPQGAPGNDYILTAQDKTDIANIVLDELQNADTMTFPIASEVNDS